MRQPWLSAKSRCLGCLLGSCCRSPQIIKGDSPKPAAKPTTASKMCSFRTFAGVCAHHHQRNVLASVANRDVHHQESLGRQKPSQRFMIIGALKRNRKGWLVGDNTCSSKFRLSVFPSVHWRSPSDIYLVFLRVSLLEPQLVLFQHSILRASPVRDVLLTCQVGPVSSQ